MSGEAASQIALQQARQPTPILVERRSIETHLMFKNTKLSRGCGLSEHAYAAFPGSS